MTTRSQAFAAQAASDLDAFTVLGRSRLAGSHRLHYLQMWLEKLCKAYLWLPGSALDDLRNKHNVVEKVLPRMIGEYWGQIGFTQRPDRVSIRQLCREIDLLHPQVDDAGRRPYNVEYPWIGFSGDAEVPAQWDFPLLSRLHSHTGRVLLKAAVSLTREPGVFME